jgi:ammonium transporter, Amt family
MFRLKLLVLALVLLSQQLWSADVSEQIIGIYERITNLQERIHQLETTSMQGGQMVKLQQEVQDVQQKIGSSAAGSATLLQRLDEIEKQLNGIDANSSALASSVPLNHVWVVICAILVMFMQTGFAFLEAGLTRSKNAVHTLTMNLMDYGIGMLAFWACGFALMFGGVGAIESLGIKADWLNRSLGFFVDGQKLSFLGWKGFFLDGFTGTPVMTFFFFQMVFAATANTICTGALAERWRIQAFCFSSIFVAGFIYPLYGSWVWGGGWLHTLGYLDFAGSTVVHTAGGIIALAGARAIGPRNGKYDGDSNAKAIPGHNLPYVFLGTFILAFGWFGFNAGSSLRAGAEIGLIVVNTALSSAAGSISGMLITRKLFGKPDPTFACNGLLAGLVAITAGCAYVAPWAAVLIGLVAGCLVVLSALLVEEKLKLDDPVGAISVHATNGIWGGLAVGIFAVPELAGRAGLVYGGVTQMLVQMAGVLSGIILFFVLGKLMFAIIGKLTKHRASDEEQEEGLDLAEMGVAAYNEE